jgi:hypothetical protein
MKTTRCHSFQDVVLFFIQKKSSSGHIESITADALAPKIKKLNGEEQTFVVKQGN